MKKILSLAVLLSFGKSKAFSNQNVNNSIDTNITVSVMKEEIEAPIDTLTRTVSGLMDDMLKLKRLKITGYVQPQFQYIDSAGAQSFAGGDFGNGSTKYTNRFTMRRARFKFTYTFENILLMVNIDARETGLAMRETYAKISDPWINMVSLTAGLLQTQFGFELTQSSSERESPERARYNQILFPVERDLGAFGSLVVPKSSKLYGLKLDVGYMNGVAGVSPEFDSFKDYTGRLQYSKSLKSETAMFSVAASYYNGGYRIGTQKDYNFNTLANGDKGFEFASDTANYNRKARKEYMGADVQTSFEWPIGITTVRAEYIQGIQPGTNESNQRANNSLAALPTKPIYHRQFNGAYFYLIQDIGTSRFQVVAKYDWFDPNVKISGEAIGKTGTGTNLGDVRFDTYGFGLNFRINSYAKVMAYYDYVTNESTSISTVKKDLKDNVFTLRFQIKY